MQKPSVSFFCPAYNDEGNIRRTVVNVMETLDRLAAEYEITIVEDGSPDGTGVEADRLAVEYPQVRVIHNPRNLGYGGALRTGFNAARKYEVVTYTDGDGQYDFSEFENLLAAWDGESVVSGYRLNRADSRSRILQSWVFEVCLRILFGLKVKDVNCSMKLFPRSALDEIRLTSDSAFIDAEILIKLSRRGYGIVQVGVHHFPRLHGAASGAKPAVIFTTISDMFRQLFGRK
jgi:glycosyltransferase involved in cell wall biosynthesis